MNETEIHDAGSEIDGGASWSSLQRYGGQSSYFEYFAAIVSI